MKLTQIPDLHLAVLEKLLTPLCNGMEPQPAAGYAVETRILLTDNEAGAIMHLLFATRSELQRRTAYADNSGGGV